MLRHVAFLEQMEAAPTARERDEAKAAFLTLRLLEQWIALGATLATPKGRAHAAAASAVKQVTSPPVAEVLQYILRGILMLREPDPQPFLGRVHGLGESLEAEGAFAAAAECYALVTRHSAADEPIHLDARIRHAFCHRALGDHQWAEVEYQRAAAIAATRRDERRMLVARIGLAKVLIDTGRVREGDRLMQMIARRLDGGPRVTDPRRKPVARRRGTGRPATKK